jgi:transcription elongation factor Elf1
MKQYFKGALEAVLDNHKDKLDSISGIHYDSYDDMEIQGEKSFNNIKFVTQTSIYNSGPSQLCRSSEYGKAGEFAECERYNIVAADHLAWPGNDFIYGNRETDEGRKGAATDVIGVMCGISGSYRTVKFADGYHPPEPYKNWYDLIIEKRIQIQVKEKIFVVSNDGIKTPLEEYQLKQSDSKSAPFSVEPLLEHSSIKPQVATSLSTSNPAQKPIEKEGGGR